MEQSNPTNPVPDGVATLSVEEILNIEKRLRENKAAALRGEPQPHNVTAEELNRAITSMRAQRGTMNLVKPTSGAAKKSNGGASITLLDLEGL